jgi:geranylgeranyl diphosphate synthase type I
MPSEDAFEPFATRVRVQVEALLRSWLTERVAEARRRGEPVRIVAEAISELVLRGGKRLRAALVAAAYEACGGERGADAVLGACAAVELLQAYLLIHDDWMDGDDERRGGASVPAMMRERLGQFGDAASVLAGDLACGWAQMSLMQLALPSDRVLRAALELARVQEDVVSGQILDVSNAAADASDVERMYALKTASYSVRCPVVMGAALAGAGDATLSAMAGFGEPLGVAFQLRDDLLGAFGDAKATGKPVGGDVRKGKRTALVVDALRDARAAELLKRASRSGAGDRDVAAGVEAIASSGARERAEERIAVLVAESLRALERARLANPSLLAGAVVALTKRER